MYAKPGACESRPLLIFIELFLLLSIASAVPVVIREARTSFTIGTCSWIIERSCPDEDVKFYLYTRSNPEDRQYVHIDESLEKSNLSSSYFNPSLPTKVIIHGYNADMFLAPLINMKGEYLSRGSYNLFYVDWSTLGPGPCYPSAVHNTKHVGMCIAQLVQRILDMGTDNVHLIGFSLGAQVSNYAAVALRPFKLRRISGLDPAMPLFITVGVEDKLDPSDADFVDVIHTNALVQGKIERCGHADFYMNGGIMQPGCWAGGQNPMACSHHRAPDYFAESIRSLTGFWGWKCASYVYYLLGFCPQSSNQVLAGEDCMPGTEGLFLINTNRVAPFATGRWSDTFGLHKKNNPALNKFAIDRDPFISDIDQWGKLDGNFNNVEQFPTPYSQDPNNANEDDWPYFNHIGTNKLTKEYIRKILEQDADRYEHVTEIQSDQNHGLRTHAEVINGIDRNDELNDLRKRLQFKEASTMEHYTLPTNLNKYFSYCSNFAQKATIYCRTMFGCLGSKVFTLSMLLISVHCGTEQLRNIDPNYGITWMFLPDDQGTPHIVDLTTPNDTGHERAGANCNEEVTFYLYRQNTRQTPRSFKFINDPAVPLRLDSSYDPKLPTKFVIHGWRNSVSSAISQQVKDAYLQREDMNVFVVDWSPLAHDTFYFKSASATRDVGRHVAGLIDRMVVEKRTDLNSIHIIGHSLGAHTSGFAGSFVRSGKVSRVTGLDPALPGFTDQQPEKLLDPSDARFVDVIHTCAGMLGHDKNLGHVDFFPNGGRANQPGCGGMNDLIGACSHGRSYEYYVESINHRDAFMAYPCGDLNEYKKQQCQRSVPIPMGDSTPIDARGIHFVDTNGEPKFGRGLRR
ncbi:uncharacterized protein LOC129773297 [Toxorhynchites rutilus septentrionalis]|uniref:uncharacterized protein LOC129773297 n=1 Tax=Toxorhynchites rutilus septentrionalis TaxID=329112 RepID=UPI0024797B8B|nr:uncharacterized protein LOC129773297 [Toxorhynchites rutilus septentrionalis]